MVTAVKVISPTRATVTYDILIDGEPATGCTQHILGMAAEGQRAMVA